MATHSSKRIQPRFTLLVFTKHDFHKGDITYRPMRILPVLCINFFSGIAIAFFTLFTL